MTEVKAQLKYFRTSPRKVRLVADLIRGLSVDKALHQLTFLDKKSSPAILKLVNSAIANAKNNFKLKKEELFVKEVRVDAAPMLKRYRARARGRACMIRKRGSHVSLVLGSNKKSK